MYASASYLSAQRTILGQSVSRRAESVSRYECSSLLFARRAASNVKNQVARTRPIIIFSCNFLEPGVASRGKLTFLMLVARYPV